jgi:cell division GTPase FtsZ
MVDIPNIPLEAFEVPSEEIQSAVGAVNTYVGSVEYGVLGSGQCGGRLAKSFYDCGYKKSLAVNTAVADLNPLELPEAQKLRIGSLQGSGKDMGKGERATEESAQYIFDKMRDVFGTVDKIIICVGFGGGTGAGGLLTLISIAQKYLDFLGHKEPAKDVIVIAALPTSGELRSYTTRKNNEHIQQLIFQLAEESKVGPIIIIDNAKIEKMYRGIPPVKFWPTINGTIINLFQIFNYLSKQESSYTSFDAEDYKAILRTPGLAVLGVTRVDDGGSRDPEISKALQDNLKKTLLADMVDYETAKEAACVVVAENRIMESVSMDVFNYGFDTMSNLIGHANVHRGLYDTQHDGIRAYTFIAGMRAKPSDTNSVY